MEKQTRRQFERKKHNEGGKPIRIPIAIILAALLGFSCSSQENRPEKTTAQKIPSSILEEATIILTTEGKKEAVIYADTLINFEAEDSTIAKDVKVDFYNEFGEYSSTLTSQEGLVRQKKNEFSVWGDVVVENDTARLDTQSLRWDPNTRLITTEDFVKFRRGTDVLTGYGMRADNRLENVQILRDVEGKFTDVPETEKELDELEGEPEKEIEP
ncbi:MAG: LPS export ABC transporter periplasmic protein LptC [Candidatus Zixiibacteriota bacterium]|nr:MAG: LPS export ABC transporter periplasmic protein LptC [candidate division Zixibacteria bacterium]